MAAPITLFNGLITSTSDHTLTMDGVRPDGFNDTTVPGPSVVTIKTIQMTNVNTTVEEVTFWKVANGGSIGDASKIVNAYKLQPGRQVQLPMNSVMIFGQELHAKSTTANKVAVDITATIEDAQGATA